jgi:large subunit ribosomal protein L31
MCKNVRVTHAQRVAMKKDIHPKAYRPVVFLDAGANFKFLTRSTVPTSETIKWEDGKEYPVVKLEISSASHPFYTGQQRFVDTAGRVEKFQRKFGGDYFKKPAKDKSTSKTKK